MPGIFDTPLSRRKFLATSAAVAGAASAVGGTGPDETSSARLALLSDTHIPAEATPTNGYRGLVPADNLRKVVEQVVASPAEVAILNGDAARSAGLRGDYHTLKGLLRPVAEKVPVHIGLGNHDDRKNFFAEFPQAPDRKELVQGKHISVFSRAGTRFVLLDSLLYVNKTPGLLGKAQRDWLTEFLKTPDESPVVFFVHHTLGEHDGELLDYDRMLRIMMPYRKVKAVFCGHAHTYRLERRERIHVVYMPAIGYNFHDSQPVGWLDATFSTAGVDLKLQAVAGETADDGKTTSIKWEA